MTAAPRTDWTIDEVKALWELPFNDLLFQAQSVHRENFDPHEVQISTLLSIKTGACPEDCSYCDYLSVCGDAEIVTKQSLWKASQACNQVLDPLRRLREIELEGGTQS